MATALERSNTLIKTHNASSSTIKDNQIDVKLKEVIYAIENFTPQIVNSLNLILNEENRYYEFNDQIKLFSETGTLGSIIKDFFGGKEKITKRGITFSNRVIKIEIFFRPGENILYFTCDTNRESLVIPRRYDKFVDKVVSVEIFSDDEAKEKIFRFLNAIPDILKKATNDRKKEAEKKSPGLRINNGFKI